jgi:hypothetical protein
MVESFYEISDTWDGEDDEGSGSGGPGTPARRVVASPTLRLWQRAAG